MCISTYVCLRAYLYWSRAVLIIGLPRLLRREGKTHKYTLHGRTYCCEVIDPYGEFVASKLYPLCALALLCLA